VLYAVLYEGDIAALQQAQQAGHIRPFGSLEVNSVASVVERLNAWKARPSPRVIPTHVPYQLYPPEVFERRVKRVYVEVGFEDGSDFDYNNILVTLTIRPA